MQIEQSVKTVVFHSAVWKSGSREDEAEVVEPDERAAAPGRWSGRTRGRVA